MKKGCFLTVVSLLTVIIAIVIYIFRFHQDDVLNIVKPFVLGKSESEVYGRIDKLSDKANSDSLKKIIGFYVSYMESSPKVDMNSVKIFFDRTNQILNDRKIDSAEISEITQYIKFKHQRE